MQRTHELTGPRRWSILTGYAERFDHGLFQVHVSRRDTMNSFARPLAYIDNDRSQWLRPADEARNGVQQQHLSDWCIFPRTLANRLFVLHRYQSDAFSLGLLLAQSVRAYSDELFLNGPLFTPDEVQVLNQNLAFVVDIISRCIEERGQERVLIPEPWGSEFALNSAALDRIFQPFASRRAP